MVKPVDPDRNFRYIFRIRLTQADIGLYIFVDNLELVRGCAFDTTEIIVTQDP